MSTRANIIITDQHGTKLYFYRHSDGYPESTGVDLKWFCEGYQKHMRDDAMQSAGWLVLHGAGPSGDPHNERCNKFRGYEWKVGDYEPTDALHSDVEYIYVIDLEHMILETRETKTGYWDKPSLAKTKVIETYSISKSPGVIGKRVAK